ncbi:protein N-terminal asparagine amidohydrolase isoform X2 [Punica granatum]|uniref:Protein N-terminal asparagine amidohydrolase isoform X2 n=1 Tax=Punica granatum TaxID=22663 RepID=A0A6P8DT50_PUNGR|nr:protein N-terminal asparagine amidohydrolase isoform X2 [Punica granatum]
MIFIDGRPLMLASSSSSSPHPQGIEILNALMGHPTVLSSSHAFKDIPERKFTSSEESSSERPSQPNFVYLFQREYAAVDPAMVDFVGTDEATTCVGLAIRNRQSGMTSVAHMDSPDVVEIGLTQMLSLVVNNGSRAELDVHLIGGFEDAPAGVSNQVSRTGRPGKQVGYSLPLCIKIVESLWKRQEKFRIQTMFVLGHNTKRDAEGNAYPIFNGFLVETATGSVFPASFDGTSRCPDEIVRRIRVTACNDDPSWKGKLLETYDTLTDKFVVAPCCWSRHQLRIALTFYSLSDPEILFTCSTSPLAEGPDFVYNIRRRTEWWWVHLGLQAVGLFD